MESYALEDSVSDAIDVRNKRTSESNEIRYSCRLCFDRLHTIPVCSFELNPSFS